MIELRDKSNGALVGTVTEEQFKFMQGELEEESVEDTDYYMNQATVDMFEEAGSDPALVTLLRQALNGREDMDIQWSKS